MNAVHVHRVTPTEKNPYRYAVIYGTPTVRFLRENKMELYAVASRQMNELEEIMNEGIKSTIFYRYEKLSQLIEDEQAVGVEPKWIDYLRNLE